MLPTKETTALEVWCHAQDHGDRPVIHGAELDYDDVHDGVHYHADLLDAAYARTRALRERRLEAADDLAFLINAWDKSDGDVRLESNLYVEYLAEWRRLNDEIKESRKATAALIAKRDQEPAHPVDSTAYTLPDGRTVIGKDAYEAEVVKAVFES